MPNVIHLAHRHHRSQQHQEAAPGDRAPLGGAAGLRRHLPTEATRSWARAPAGTAGWSSGTAGWSSGVAACSALAVMSTVIRRAVGLSSSTAITPTTAMAAE